MTNEYTSDNARDGPGIDTCDGQEQIDEFVYLNNSKVASSICNRTDIYTAQLGVCTMKGRDNQDINTTVLLNFPQEFIDTSLMIDEYDKQIMNMVYSLYLEDRDYFTPSDIANKMDGTVNKRISPDRVDKIVGRLEKMRTVLITIDCSKEFANRNLIPKGTTAKFKGYLMPIEEVEVTAPNGRKIHAYHLIKAMELYEYASKINQIIKMPTSVIRNNKKMPDGDTVAILRNYLYMRISTIKNAKASMNSRRIRYDTLFDLLGLKPQNYHNWRKKYSAVRHMILKIMSQFQANGLITSFGEYKKGAKTVGVCFDY